jgi:hypothetical protein
MLLASICEEVKEHGMDKHATEHGHLTVTDLTVVSDTCPM